MTKHDDLARILHTGIVAVVRADSSEALVELSKALVNGGVDAIEITFTVPAAHRVLEQVTTELKDRAIVGAGTVLDAETARIAILSGARFIVSPVVRHDVIRLCRRYDKIVVPGALTPTEVLDAWEQGADLVKIFPSDLTGSGYLKALSGPLPQVRLMPSGGVNLETATDFLKAGAAVLSVGGSLVDPAALKAREFRESKP